MKEVTDLFCGFGRCVSTSNVSSARLISIFHCVKQIEDNEELGDGEQMCVQQINLFTAAYNDLLFPVS